MKKKNKMITTYIMVNLILLFVAVLLIAFLWCEYYFNKQNIIIDLGEQSNIIISTIEVEKEKTESEVENTTVIVPITIDQSIVESEEIDEIKFKYYYNELNDNAKIIYDTIEKNINNLKTGTYTIKLPTSVANILNQDNGTKQLNEDFQSAWDAIMTDRVDLFFIDISKIVMKIKSVTYGNSTEYKLTLEPNNNENYYEKGFTNKQTVELALNQTVTARNSIISQLSGDTYNKILQVHDCLVDNFEYGTDISGNNSYNIYGALVNKNVVCEGYAEAFKYIMDGLDIPCILVSGTARNSEGVTENHEWNYVKLENEKWYAVDVTWDDPIILGGGVATHATKHKYFLKGSYTMNSNHFTNGKFSRSGMTFEYPNLEIENY